MQWIGDRGGHACLNRHADEGAVKTVAVGQTKADVGSAAGGVDLEFGAQAVNQFEHFAAGGVCLLYTSDAADDYFWV